jgi:acetyltransferase
LTSGSASELAKTERGGSRRRYRLPRGDEDPSPDILHKTDIGGIKLNVRSETEVRDAFDLLVYRARRFMPDATIWGVQVQQMVRGGREVIIGMNRDPQFGPLIMFGLGGIYVEALKDVTFRVAPIDRREATDMPDEIRSYNLLLGVR